MHLEIPDQRAADASPCPGKFLFPLYIMVLIYLDRGCLMIAQDASQDFIRLVHTSGKLREPSWLCCHM